MDFEYNQIYEGQPGFEATPAATGGSQTRESRMDYRYEVPDRSPSERRASYGNEPSRFGFGRYSNQKNKKGLLGLSNLGNTCFMNAALQCLTHTHGLQKYFRFCSHALSSKSQSSRQKLVMSFAHWFERDWGRNVSAHYHSPEDILKYVQQLNPTFQGYVQQDSQEFLRCVLDNLHEELRREVPDDLHSHLLRCFGLEAPGEAAAAAAAALGVGGSASSVANHDEEAGPLPGGQRRPGMSGSAAPSATRQLMQLCQSTEGVTDVDEIRLPWKPAPPLPKGPLDHGVSVQTTGSAALIPMPASQSQRTSAPSGEREGDRAVENPTPEPLQQSASSSTTSGTGGLPVPAGNVAGGSSGAPTTGAGAGAGAGAVPSQSSTRGDAKAEAKREREREREREEDTAPTTHFSSIVSELFQGRVVSVVRCLECQKTSRTLEVVYDVSVPIPNANELGNPHMASVSEMNASSNASPSQAVPGLRGPTWSGMLTGIPGKVKSWFYDKGVEVTDCLKKYCAPELLGGKDKYFCEHCKRKNDCEKRIAFKDLPEVLCIHIKRFRYDAGWFNGTKNSRVVTFPVNKTLDLSAFLEEPPHQPAEYRLIGLIQHIGSMGGGHYIAYCQHKRRPQEWYEFDDLQVSVVKPEQVERAEPYVLFYQRVPSRGCRLDRQTFKADMRRVDAQVRQHLLSSRGPGPQVPQGSSSSPTSSASASAAAPPVGGPGQSSPSPSLGAGGGGASAVGSATSGVSPSGSASLAEAVATPESAQATAPVAAQAVAEEMRQHGPALRGLYRHPPEELGIVFVTKHWYVRLTTMSQPGPLDNFEYLCPHQLLGSDSAELAAEPFIPISRSLFVSLRQKYGGGPALHSLEICSKCKRHLSAYNERKQAEFDLVSKYDTKDTGDGRGWYLVDATWVNRWKRYVRSEPVTDVRDMCAPGPITNGRLLDRERPGCPRTGLRLRIDYIGVNARVWWLFLHVHGGGPTLCREELDIYSPEFSPETELQLDELRGRATADFALRISRQLVDECQGDLDLYEHRYGTNANRQASAA